MIFRVTHFKNVAGFLRFVSFASLGWMAGVLGCSWAFLKPHHYVVFCLRCLAQCYYGAFC